MFQKQNENIENNIIENNMNTVKDDCAEQILIINKISYIKNILNYLYYN